MKPPTRWYARNPELEAERAGSESAATALLRAADHRVRRSKPTPSPPSATLLPSPTGWLPLADLRHAMRAKERGRP
jgi:hypothetical protein